MKRRKGCRMICDVGEATEGWRMSSAAHSQTFPSLHLRHSSLSNPFVLLHLHHRSFSNPSVSSPTPQLVLQPFRPSIYNRCNYATVRTQVVPLVHVSCESLLYHVHAVASCNTWFINCGTNGKITLWMPLVF